jgi:hypothetical protein
MSWPHHLLPGWVLVMVGPSRHSVRARQRQWLGPLRLITPRMYSMSRKDLRSSEQARPDNLTREDKVRSEQAQAIIVEYVEQLCELVRKVKRKMLN